METRHTLLRTQSFALFVAILFIGCGDSTRKEAFLSDPAPEATAEHMAAVDALRFDLRVGRGDESPLAGRWEIMNLINTAVAVISEDEAIGWLGVMLVYTEDESVLIEDACPKTTYDVRKVPFDEYFLDYDISPDELKITTDPIEVITLSCNGSVWNVPGAEVIRVSDERLIVNWDGMLYVLWPYPG
jgi:hypothetical protein